ncbi:hypothetical protein Moror_4333 [Moniliophthora roreri MCA 2997]|uniref:Uncharacterized protein n=1 Tax=Moniliophthora roreri (strain MCA 2997) TaxID=1381753 RepID=V2XJH2_MONRO|nr:hypothetical protein Moror_4333 [Moniliophthora roreri MCA 2997]
MEDTRMAALEDVWELGGMVEFVGQCIGDDSQILDGDTRQNRAYGDITLSQTSMLRQIHTLTSTARVLQLHHSTASLLASLPFRDHSQLYPGVHAAWYQNPQDKQCTMPTRVFPTTPSHKGFTMHFTVPFLM